MLVEIRFSTTVFGRLGRLVVFVSHLITSVCENELFVRIGQSGNIWVSIDMAGRRTVFFLHKLLFSSYL